MAHRPLHDRETEDNSPTEVLERPTFPVRPPLPSLCDRLGPTVVIPKPPRAPRFDHAALPPGAVRVSPPPTYSTDSTPAMTFAAAGDSGSYRSAPTTPVPRRRPRSGPALFASVGLLTAAAGILFFFFQTQSAQPPSPRASAAAAPAAAAPVEIQAHSAPVAAAPVAAASEPRAEEPVAVVAATEPEGYVFEALEEESTLELEFEEAAAEAPVTVSAGPSAKRGRRVAPAKARAVTPKAEAPKAPPAPKPAVASAPKAQPAAAKKSGPEEEMSTSKVTSGQARALLDSSL